MTDLYNSQTGLLESVPDEKAEESFLSGSHVLKSGDLINVFDPETEKTLKVPAQKAADYLSVGFKFETEEQKILRQVKNDPANDSLLAATKQFGKQAFNQALLGVPEIINDAMRDNVGKARAEAMAEKNPVANIAGGVTGFLASMLYGGPLWKGAGAVGEGAAKAVITAAELGGEKLAKSAATKVLANIAKAATENVVVGLPARITESVLGDKDTVAESLMAGVAEDALVGGAFGGLMIPLVSKGASIAAGKITPEALESMSQVRHLKAVGYKQQQIEKILEEGGPNAVRETSEFLEKEGFGGIKNTFKSASDNFRRGKQLLTTYGQQIGEVYKRADEINPNAISLDSLLGRIDDVDPQSKKALSINALLAQNGRIVQKKVTGENHDLKLIKAIITEASIEKGQPLETLSFDKMRQVISDVAEIAAPNGKWKDGSKAAQDAYFLLRDNMNSALAQVGEQSADMGFKTSIKELNSKYSKLQKIVPVLRKAQARNEGNNLISPTDYLAITTGGLLGDFSGGVTGGVLNYAKRHFGDQLASSTLFGMAKVLDQTTKRVDQAINGFVKTTGAKAQPFKLGSVNAFSRLLGDEDDSREDKQKKFNKVSQMITSVASNPEAITSTMSSLTSPYYDAAPDITESLNTKMSDAMSYLAAHLPKPDSATGIGNPRQYIPTDRELASFSRKLNAVLEPLSILDEVAQGTLSQDSADAVRTVYPKLFQAIQTRVVERLGIAESLDYKTRSRLRYLLDEPMGTSVSTQQRKILQEQFQPKEGGMPRANSKITESSRSGTEIDRITYGN